MQYEAVHLNSFKRFMQTNVLVTSFLSDLTFGNGL